MYKKIIALISMLFCLDMLLIVERSCAQGAMLQHFGVSDGLPSNYLYAVMQDRKGYIWFVSDNGVSRFDGIEFVNYSTAEGLPDNDIVSIAEDARGRIWLSCYNGIPCFIDTNYKVNIPIANHLLQGFANGDYTRFAFVGKKVLMTTDRPDRAIEVDGQGRLRVLKHLGGSFMHVGNYLLALSAVRSGKLLLYDEHYHQATQRRLDEIGLKQLQQDHTDIFACGDNSFVILLNQQKVFRYKIVSSAIQWIDSFVLPFRASNLYNWKGKLWLQSDNKGLVRVDSALQEDKSRQTVFPGKMIQYAIQDREGNYWGVTPGNGVYMAVNNGVRVYAELSGQDNSCFEKLAQRNNCIYLGNNHGELSVWSADGSLSKLENAKGNHLQGKMTCLYATHSYVIFAMLNQVRVLGLDKHKLKGFTDIIQSGKCIYPAGKDTIWLGTHSSCYKIKLPATILDTIRTGRTTAILKRKNGELLVGTHKGLLSCTKKADGAWSIDTLPVSRHLYGTSISFLKEKNGILLIGTSQKGLLLQQGEDYEFVHSGEILRGANCKTVFVDSCIWVSTFSGLYKIALEGDIHHYRIDDVGMHIGLANWDVNDFLLYRDTLYLAAPHSVYALPLSAFREKKAMPPFVYLNEVSVDDSTMTALELGSACLKGGQHNFRFHFSAIDFRSQGNLLFKYRLKGLRETWQYTRQNNIHYDALAPGTYHFEVSAMNVNKQWASQVAGMSFVVLPYWWQTDWFRLLFSLMLLFAAYWLVRRYLHRKYRTAVQEQTIKKQIAEIELKAIKAQINPHFIFNTLNTIQYFVAKGDAASAEQSLEKLSRLMRSTLRFSDKTSVSLEEEIDYLNTYLQLEKLRFDESFQYQIVNTVSREETLLIQLPSMVLQPHIENALRHAFKGLQSKPKILIIRFSLNDDSLVCEIEDNGVGRLAAYEQQQDKFRPQSGKGLELSYAKLKMYEQLSGKEVATEIVDLYRADKASGTLVSIKLKL